MPVNIWYVLRQQIEALAYRDDAAINRPAAFSNSQRSRALKRENRLCGMRGGGSRRRAILRPYVRRPSRFAA